jgi:G3E family GTPase
MGAVVATLGADRVVDDLLGDALLRDRDRHTNPWDDRGVGEVACAQVEFADVVVLDSDPGAEALDLVRSLARPDAALVVGADRLDGLSLSAHRHQHSVTSSWCALEQGHAIPRLATGHAWRLELSSLRPFHPERLLDQIDRLGSGPHRSRGCFWLPTRRGAVLEWSGAGGQLSIGSHSRWGRGAPRTRLLLTGLGDVPHDLVVAFDDLLLTPAEERQARHAWDVPEDGLEPWLGDIRDVA